jgi:ribosome maturation factor RimP
VFLGASKGLPVTLVEAFERAASALPAQAEFVDVEIISHQARRAKGATALTLVVDRPGGVDLELCERIAGRLNAALEASSNEPYTLEVESAGLDRPLVRAADYDRFKDSRVKILTTITVNGAKTHRGRLLGMRGANVILHTAEVDELPLPLQIVKSARLEYDIRADLSREKRERRRK